MSIISKLSKWQALFRKFEGSVGDFENVSVRTENIANTRPFSNPQMAHSLAREISRLIQLEDAHYQFRRERIATFAGEKGEVKELSNEEYEDIEAQLKELRGASTEVVDRSGKIIDGSNTYVDISLIDLREITEDSKVEVKVFPLSFWCNVCGHYEIIDPRTKRNLECPCCKLRGRHNELEQFSYVFACPRCANLEEFTPRLERIDQVRGSVIPCPDCKEGHLHFYVKESFQTAFWRCTNPDCIYNSRPFGERKLDKFCKCHIRKGPHDEEGRSSIMKPTPTSASSIAYPLIRSYLYMGTNYVTIESLENMHEETKGTDIYQWRLSEKVSDLDMKMISEIYDIEDVFTVPKITTITVVYGYKSGISSHPVIIPDNERLAKLFKHGRKYRVYVVKTEGRGLVIKLNKEKLLNFLQLKLEYDKIKSYDEIVHNEISFLLNGDFQYIIDNPDYTKLVSLLHALEHSFFKCAMNQVGLEIFGSKILMEDCAIVLYEREEVGSGGLTQLTLGEEGREFKKYLLEVGKNIENCPQLCNSACPACAYINDFYCQPFMPNEVERWFPPNSLLNRNLANQFLKYQEATNNSSKG